MGAGWLPWSAASMASGAVLLVLAAVSMPPTGDLSLVPAAIQSQGPAWLLASIALLLASAGLTLGMPSIVWLFPTSRHQVWCLVGVWTWAMGTLGVSAIAGMLVLLRAAVGKVGLTGPDLVALARDHSLVILVTAVVVAFHLGELLVALLLLHSRVVARWVPVLLVVHVAIAPLVHLLPPRTQGFQVIVLGVALMGIAVKATESWAGSRTPTAL